MFFVLILLQCLGEDSVRMRKSFLEKSEDVNISDAPLSLEAAVWTHFDFKANERSQGIAKGFKKVMPLCILQ